MLRRVVESRRLLDIKDDGTGKVQIAGYKDIPALSGESIEEYAAWFMGPRAENIDLLKDMSAKVLEHIKNYREGYLPGDPPVITSSVKNSKDFGDTKSDMYARLAELLRYYERYATPFFSLRYQGHMLWDNTLPAIAGYFATMLHNPNNVTIQASTATTLLELVVMRDLCAMVGWMADDGQHPRPWAHITADGSIANIEGAWAARETKYLPFAVREAVAHELKPARDIEVTITDGTVVLVREATNWQLFNIRRDDILALPARIAELSKGKLKEHEVWTLLVPYCPNAKGMTEMARYLEGTGGTPVVLTHSTRHYSWPKATATLGFGTDCAVTVTVDRDGRMDMDKLEEKLCELLAAKRPVLMTVAVLGSTEESSIDPIDEILDLREKFRGKGLEFDIHVDAAWGGYQISGVRKDFDMHGVPKQQDRATEDDDLFDLSQPKLPVSRYTAGQLTRVRRADSATIDPHKSGYVQYPAGSILYRNDAVTNLITFTGAYIGPAAVSAGMFGLEGSRPGAAAGAVYFSHRCIRPSLSGYGRITKNAWFNARMFYVQILCMDDPNGDTFVPVPLSLLPSERKGKNPAAEKEYIRTNVLWRSKQDIERDADVMELFRELGPDMNIVNYGFRDLTAAWSADAYNKLITDIYDAFHVAYDREGQASDIHKYPLLLTMTTFDRSEYGDQFMNTFARRLGIEGTPDKLNCLRSVVMDPYFSEEAVAKHYFPLIIGILRKKVRELTRHPESIEA